MPKSPRVAEEWLAAGHRVNVSATHTATTHANKRFARQGNGLGNVYPLQRSRCLQNECFHVNNAAFAEASCSVCLPFRAFANGKDSREYSWL